MRQFFVLLAMMFALLTSSPGFAQSAPVAPPPGTTAPAQPGGIPPSNAPATSQFSGIGGPVAFVTNLFVNNTDSFAERRSQAEQSISSAGCWPCSIFGAFVNQGFEAIKKADSASRGFSSVIVGFATVFAFFYLGSAFVSGDAGDLLSRWQVFWRLCIAVAAGTAVISAGASSFVWDYVYGPLMLLAQGMAEMFGTASSAAGCQFPGAPGVPTGATAAIEMMQNVVCGGWKMTTKGMAAGFALGLTVEGFSVATFSNFVAGLILVVAFAWISVTFVLRFIDVIIKLAIVSMITPILVVLAVFKPTRGYVRLGISNVVNAGLQFAIVSIMFGISWSMFESVLNGMFNASSSEQGNLFQAMVLIAYAVILGSMIRQVPAIAAEFSGAPAGGGEIGNAAIGSASNMIAIPAKGASTVISGGASAAIQGSVAGARAASALRAGGALEKGVAGQ